MMVHLHKKLSGRRPSEIGRRGPKAIPGRQPVLARTEALTLQGCA